MADRVVRVESLTATRKVLALRSRLRSLAGALRSVGKQPDELALYPKDYDMLIDEARGQQQRGDRVVGLRFEQYRVTRHAESAR